MPNFDHLINEISSAVAEKARATGWTHWKRVKLGDRPGGTIIDSVNTASGSVFWHVASDDGTGTVREQGTAVLGSDLAFLYSNDPSLTDTDLVIGFPPQKEAFYVWDVDAVSNGQQFSGKPLARQFLDAAGQPSLAQVSTLRATVNADLSVTVGNPAEYYVYPHSQTLALTVFTVGTADLSATVAALATGKHRLALVCLDKSTNTLAVLLSASVDASAALPARSEFGEVTFATFDLLNNPAYQPEVIVYLYKGQTAFVSADRFPLEVRPAFPPVKAFLALKDKYDASAAPTADDDSTLGYSLGSRWYDTTANIVYVCFSAAEGAAVWRQGSALITGAGDVVGPGSATDGHVAVFDGDGQHIRDGGAAPVDGRNAGVKYTYLTDVANSDPGSGKLKFNNATLASASILHISETDGDTNALAPWLATWDDSTSTVKGQLFIRKDSDPAVFMVFNVTGSITDAGAYDNFTVAYVASNGAFANNDAVKVHFFRTGDLGATGSAGATGAAGSNGTNGTDGRNAGLKYTYLTDTASSDPGSGKLKFNNTIGAFANSLRISETDGDGNGVGDWLATWDDSTSSYQGVMTIRKDSDPSVFAMFRVTGQSDNGAWDSVSVFYLLSNGSFANNDVVKVDFQRTGDKGNAGTDGKWVGLLYAYRSDITNSDPGAASFKFDNATLSAATILRIYETDSYGDNHAAWIASWDDSTSTIKGYVEVRKAGNITVFALFAVTGSNTDVGAYDNVNITYVTGSGSWSNGDLAWVSFIRNGDKGDTGATGSAGSNGSNGTNGADGRNAGLKYTYLTDTANSDPGSGKLKFDNATLASAVTLRISETDADTNALAAYLATWDDSTSTIRATFTMRKDSDPAVYAIYSITGTITDSGAWDSFTVAYVGGNGAFANNDTVKVIITRTGDKGDTGATGADGTGPAGSVVAWPTRTAPTNWLLCSGQAVSRSTYATLFNLLVPSLGTVTVTIASPGVFSLAAHGLAVGDSLYFTTTGALPTGLTANTLYYVSAVPTSGTFKVSATYGGADVNTSGSQSGTHTAFLCPYGLGDGSTTFNVPDLRGRFPLGNDSMGGTSANRVVAGQADNLGQSGGEETHTLITSELPSHTHTQRGNTNNVTTGTTGMFGRNGTANDGNAGASASAGSDGAHNTMSPYLTMNFIIKT